MEANYVVPMQEQTRLAVLQPPNWQRASPTKAIPLAWVTNGTENASNAQSGSYFKSEASLSHKPTHTGRYHQLYCEGCWSRSRRWCETISDKGTQCHFQHLKHGRKSQGKATGLFCRRGAVWRTDLLTQDPHVSLWRTPASKQRLATARCRFLSQK